METMAHVVQKNTAIVLLVLDFLDLVMLMDRAFVTVLVITVDVQTTVKIAVDQHLL